MTANKTRPVQATAPKRIYLQGGPQLPENIDFSAPSEVTWCRDDVDGTGIPYVRADLAGAAPAAVTPRTRDLLGIVRTAQAEARRLINGEDSGSDLAQTKLDLPETLRVLEHALSQPAAVAWPALGVTLDEDQAGLLRDMLGDPAEYEEALTVRLIVCDGHSGHGLYVAQAEYQDEGAALLAPLPATAAPALEAPAAPVGSARQFIEWMYSQPEDREPTTAEGALLEFEAHLAAAAPQAPNCTRCSGSGEDPEGFLTHGRGPDDHAVDGPCRECDGTGAAPQAPAAPLAAIGAAPAAPAEAVTPPVIDERAMKEAFDSATAEGKSFNDALRAAACATIWKRAARSDGAPNAVPAAMSAIATECALHAEERHSYLPNTPAQAATWRPHDWVLQAMSRAISFDRMLNLAAPAAPAVDAREAEPIQPVVGPPNRVDANDVEYIAVLAGARDDATLGIAKRAVRFALGGWHVLTYEELQAALRLCDQIIHRHNDHATHQDLAGALRPIIEKAMIATPYPAMPAIAAKGTGDAA